MFYNKSKVHLIEICDINTVENIFDKYYAAINSLQSAVNNASNVK